MNKKPKILEEGESTYRNGGGSMCGGVVSQSMFDSDPWAYMMAYYMPDNVFKEYVKAKRAGMDKRADKLFEEYARSAI